jgi:hypothetical protein
VLPSVTDPNRSEDPPPSSDEPSRDVPKDRSPSTADPDTPGLGREPTAGEAHGHWRQADRVLKQTQRRLGVEVDRDRDLHRER